MSAGTYSDELREIRTFILLEEIRELIRQGEAELRAYRDQEAARAFIDAAEAQQWIDEHEDEEYRYNHNHDSKGRFTTVAGGGNGAGSNQTGSLKDGIIVFLEKGLEKLGRSSIIRVKDKIRDSAHSAEPASIAGIEKGSPMTFDQADNGAANPNYNENSYGFSNNCQTCVVAHEARMRGYDIEAKALNELNGYQQTLRRNKAAAYIDPMTGKQPKSLAIANRFTAYNELESKINPGERYEFAYSHHFGSHIITASKTKSGEVMLYDPQKNIKATGRTEIADYLDRREAHDISVLRVDNLDFNENVVNNILKKSKG